MIMNHIEAWLLIGIILLIGIVLFLMGTIGQLKNDITRMQTTLDIIAKQAGVPDVITEDIKADLEKLIYDGKMIEAVKKYRIITGASLKESNDYIAQLKHSLE